MPLNKTVLQTSIEALMTDLAGRNENPEQARKDFAAQLADLIDGYVKSGTVNVTVSTVGTAAAQTGTGTGTIS